MYGRTYPDGEAALEALLRQVDVAAARAVPGGPPAGADAETLAQALDGEAMDFDSLRQAWSAMPPDIKQYLFGLARQTWDARGYNLYYLVDTAFSLMRGGMAPVPALRQAALQLRIPQRRETHPRGMSPAQVREYIRRQRQRGYHPGRPPHVRALSQREAEWQDSPAPPPANQQLIPPWELVTRRIASPADTGDQGGYRGVSKDHRQWAKDVYDRQLTKVNQERAAAGLPPLAPKPVSVGHVNPFAFTPPGGTVPVRPQETVKNKGEGAKIREARKARTAQGLFVRQTQKK
ncbi:MAG TPA: hypothetical protein VF736_21825 [Pyrinomonadaceae bacterium]|jgi:hypothetical protein